MPGLCFASRVLLSRLWIDLFIVRLILILLYLFFSCLRLLKGVGEEGGVIRGNIPALLKEACLVWGVLKNAFGKFLTNRDVFANAVGWRFVQEVKVQRQYTESLTPTQTPTLKESSF